MDNLTLENGLKLGFIDNIETEYTYIHLKGYAGSNLESRSNIGAAHLLEHIIVGTGPHLVRTKKIGVLSRDSVMYGYKAPKEDLLSVFRHICEILAGNVTIPKELISFKQEVYPEIFRHVNTPEKYILRLVNSTIFKKHRINKLNTGSMEDVQKLTYVHIKDFYDKYYVPSNFCVFLAGKIDKKIVSEFCTKLGKLKYREPSAHNATPLFKPGQVINTVKQDNVPGSLMKINYPGFSISNPNKYSRMVLSGILDRKIKAILPKGSLVKFRCQEFNALTYGFTDIFIWLSDKSWESAYKKVENYINTFTVTGEELEIEKYIVRSKILMNLDKLSNLTDYYSDLLLACNETVTMENELEAIEKLSLTLLSNSLKQMLFEGPKVTVLY